MGSHQSSPAARMAQEKRRSGGRKAEAPVASRLREVREALGLSLRDVQRGTRDVTHTTIRNYESGTLPRIDHARILAAFFGTTVDELWPPNQGK